MSSLPGVSPGLSLTHQQKEILYSAGLQFLKQDRLTLQMDMLRRISFSEPQQQWFQLPYVWAGQDYTPAEKMMPVAYLLLLSGAFADFEALAAQHNFGVEQYETISHWCIEDMYGTGFTWLAETYGIDTYAQIDSGFSHAVHSKNWDRIDFLMSLRYPFEDEVQVAFEQAWEYANSPPRIEDQAALLWQIGTRYGLEFPSSDEEEEDQEDEEE